MKGNHEKTKVMVSGDITMNGTSKSKADQCGVCRLRGKANSVLWVHCSKWIHSKCGGVKRVTATFQRNFAHRKCDGNIGEAVEQED